MRQQLQSVLLALTVSLIAACAPSSTAAADRSAEVAAVPSALEASLEAAATVASGTFDGRNDHVVTGDVTIVEVDGNLVLRLSDAFTLDGAPDPKIGFGRSGEYDTTTTFTPLRANAGAQDYVLPSGFELGSLNEAYIWCEDFSVALGVAELRR